MLDIDGAFQRCPRDVCRTALNYAGVDYSTCYITHEPEKGFGDEKVGFSQYLSFSVGGPLSPKLFLFQCLPHSKQRNNTKRDKFETKQHKNPEKIKSNEPTQNKTENKKNRNKNEAIKRVSAKYAGTI